MLRWQFWIDRGGTFTDVVARNPEGRIFTHKLLSHNPERYRDAALAGIRHFLGIAETDPIPAERVQVVKMGTTVATNALLERKGEPTLLVTTRGFGDALRIAYQNRPRIFDRHIVLPELLYVRAIEAAERVTADGTVLEALDAAKLAPELRAAFDEGLRAVAIVFLHGDRYPAHERAVAELARSIGFTQVSTSHEVSPLMKIVPRGDTTVVDAYLSPILRRYVDQVEHELGDPSLAPDARPRDPSLAADARPRDPSLAADARPRDPSLAADARAGDHSGEAADPSQRGVRLMFMQSSGGLADARRFRGKDAVLSGPAGGIVGMSKTSAAIGAKYIIGFDMGGTSTDVSHFQGQFERTLFAQVAGIRMRAPMLSIHTVAAGGGSILHFDGNRLRVGPHSAGAVPGPASYRRSGPLTVTDANVMLGRIQPAYFPHVFGPSGDLPLDTDAVQEKFAELARHVDRAAPAADGHPHRPEDIAEGALRIAVANMANAIKKISVQRGHDIKQYTLTTFGGAGGQHACRVADELGMTKVLFPPFAGVLSAYGIGLADAVVLRERGVEAELDDALVEKLDRACEDLGAEGTAELLRDGVPRESIHEVRQLRLRYAGTDSSLPVPWGARAEMASAFERMHVQRYAFTMDRPLVVEAVSVEVVGSAETPETHVPARPNRPGALSSAGAARMFHEGAWMDAPIYRHEDMRAGDAVEGPAILAEANGTIVVEPEWRASFLDGDYVLLSRIRDRAAGRAVGTAVDPVMLEIFNNLFMSIAEQMGVMLENTAHSVNIKERLDFSCAIFDSEGNLVANAPHMPVHLGSMGESVQEVMRRNQGQMKPGDVYAINDPYHGGTHIPDITVVTPVWDGGDTSSTTEPRILFYVASRGHHAEIGGITPGSMPPFSTSIDEEGVRFDNWLLVQAGRFREAETFAKLQNAAYPSRNPHANMADLRAQVAANEEGIHQLEKMIAHFGLGTVSAYMQHVQDNAEECVRRAIAALAPNAPSAPNAVPAPDAEAPPTVYEMDGGQRIVVRVRIDRQARAAEIDFTGTSAQLPNNFNAPKSVTMAAVLYVFRTLVEDDIPLNAGCFRPLRVIIPDGSMLAPSYPAPTVAGNVETSQAITGALYAALNLQAEGSGTMNNVTFGNERHQYYETIASGSGAGRGFDGTPVVQTHMTNSRLTDPEVLEHRYPVLLEGYAIRRGSGGAGTFRGGDGGTRRIRFLEPMTVSVLSGHRRVPPYGMAGGEPGDLGRNWIERKDGRIDPMKGCDSAEVGSGDVFVLQSPGGGGYGEA
ncbi:hydantoinase B/oxoprolinase family protein [Pendulispora albinea]|uniref:Hydantoinase B/oxoprolinase family protein n=1 Tax=Pendulispora albinea TaxID=2741071 RepID=A0ABZ2LMH4_9BACT